MKLKHVIKDRIQPKKKLNSIECIDVTSPIHFFISFWFCNMKKLNNIIDVCVSATWIMIIRTYH